MFSKLFSEKLTSPTRSVFRWFLLGFLLLSVICLLVQIPLIIHCRQGFTELETEKSLQQLRSGIHQLDTATSTVTNASISLSHDSRFYSLHYPTKKDYSHIPATTRNQMRDYLASLMMPSTLILDSVLQLSDVDAVTQNTTTFNTWTGYYPFHFQIDELSFEEWEAILRENHTGYLPVCKVTTPYHAYDALIYSTEWGQDKYLYACMNIADIRKAMIGTENLDTCKLTIQRNDGACLYTELEGSDTGFASVSEKTSSGGLTVTVHIPNSIYAERMRPLYLFLTIYLISFLAVIMIFVLCGTRIFTMPLLNIISFLEQRKRTPEYFDSNGKKLPGYGFRFIQNQVQSYEAELQEYQSAIEIHSKVLQARYMEKALHGNLITESDLNTFYSYFPGFPSIFRLVLLGVTEDSARNGNIYPNVMAIVQNYLQQIAPNSYIQQITGNTLLMIFDEAHLQPYTDGINLLIENINREEPCYHMWGIISKTNRSPKDISFAYMQIQDLHGKVSTDSLTKLCTVSDIKVTRNSHFQISDTTAIYSAIIHGNRNMALFYLKNYEEHLTSRSVYQMFYSILLCIKHEYADLLMDIKIPVFRPQMAPYPALEECITSFCQLLQSEADANSESFAQQVKTYIDMHYPEESLCSVTLEDHFKCSFVKIRKSFSKQFGISISAYIESKRMSLANELLMQGSYSISQVFHMCGYSNYNTFLKAYRRTYGVTPSSLKQGKGTVDTSESSTGQAGSSEE